jgi:uncharacterized protein
MDVSIPKLWRRCKTNLHKVCIITGMIFMTNVSASGAPVFKLRPPQFYFTDNKTLNLLDSAMRGDLSKAKQFVAEGANPNDEGPRENQYNRLRLLHYAIAANNPKAVRILVEVGADPELNAEGFGEAFLFVITLENLDMLSLLLDLRPVANLTRETLKAMLFESVDQPCQGCLELLLKRGAPIDFPDDAGYTIMMSAMDTQDYDLAEWLLLQGASVNLSPEADMSPAYLVQFHLQKFKPGSPPYNKVLHLKKLMEERGAVFPPLSPAEVRARRAGQ